MSSNVRLNDKPTNNGFLSGFVEGSVEMPSDGKNGDCVVHYKDEHSQYELIVKLVNGIREGEGVIVNDGVPYLNLHYDKGLLTGVVERMNEYGVVDMRGHLVNGKESGLFLEYDRSKKVVWKGYYRNGVRYSGVTGSDRLKGYYDERNVSEGSLLSIAQYNSFFHDKNGRCMEYENGEWVGEWVYENGMRKQPIREYRNGILTIYDSNGHKTYEGKMSKEDVKDGFYGHEPMEGMEGFCKEVDSDGHIFAVGEYDQLRMKKNGKCFELENGKVRRVCLYENDKMIRVMTEFNGSTMIEYDENGKQAYEGGFSGDMKSGFKREGKGKEFVRSAPSENGTATEHSEPSALIGTWKNGKKTGEFYEVDMDGSVKRKCFYGDEETSHDVQRFTGTVMTELNENGKRVYEGGFKGDMEHGFVREGKGKEFVNGSRVAVYSGEWKSGKRDGFGTEFKGFKPVYTGEWKSGKRNGEGEEMDERGNVVRSGRWVNGIHESDMKSVVVPSSLTSNPQTIEELKIGNNGYNDSSVTELKLSGLARLKRIIIGDDCFGSVRVVELDGLFELESVVIGKRSLTYAKTDNEIWNHVTRTDGACRIVNCSKLNSIQASDRSFSDYHSFELNNLPSLQSIYIDDWCFYWAPSFSLTDLPQLQSVKLGQYAFEYAHSVVFENLPKLQFIQLGGQALQGDNRNDRETIRNKPFNYNNILTMQNLPSLTEFKGNGQNFYYIGSVILENIPKLSSDGIEFGYWCFFYTYSLQSSSTYSPFSSSFDATALESAIRSKWWPSRQ